MGQIFRFLCLSVFEKCCCIDYCAILYIAKQVTENRVKSNLKDRYWQENTAFSLVADITL